MNDSATANIVLTIILLGLIGPIFLGAIVAMWKMFIDDCFGSHHKDSSDPWNKHREY